MKNKEAKDRYTQNRSHNGNNNDNRSLTDIALTFGDDEDDHVDDQQNYGYENGGEKHDEISVISFAYACAYETAVVVEYLYAVLAG